MDYDPQIHHRHSIRVPDFDYSNPGEYFFTSVIRGRDCLLGEIKNGEMHTNQFGRIVQNVWGHLTGHYPHLELGTFCIMPNHVHGILIIKENDNATTHITESEFPNTEKIHESDENLFIVGAGLRPAPTMATKFPLSEYIRAFKSFSARQINILRGTPGVPVWQRSYYEHIIRNNEDLNRIHNYVESNPLNWENDDEFAT